MLCKMNKPYSHHTIAAILVYVHFISIGKYVKQVKHIKGCKVFLVLFFHLFTWPFFPLYKLNRWDRKSHKICISIRLYGKTSPYKRKSCSIYWMYTFSCNIVRYKKKAILKSMDTTFAIQFLKDLCD